MPTDSTSRDRRRLKRQEKRSARKPRHHKGHKRSEMQEDISEHESDLDLDNDIRAIGGYVDDREDLVEHMFRSISKAKLRAMLPEILRPIAVDELKRLCIEEVEVMSKKRILRILDGENADAISSSGTEDSSPEEFESGEEGAFAESTNQKEEDGLIFGSDESEYEEIIEYVEEEEGEEDGQTGEGQTGDGRTAEGRDSDVECIEEEIESVEVLDSEDDGSVKTTKEKDVESERTIAEKQEENKSTVKAPIDLEKGDNREEEAGGRGGEKGSITGRGGEAGEERMLADGAGEARRDEDTRRVVQADSLLIKRERINDTKQLGVVGAVSDTKMSGVADAGDVAVNVIKHEKPDPAYDKHTRQEAEGKQGHTDGVTKPEKQLRKKQEDDGCPSPAQENADSDMEEGEIQSSSESENEREEEEAEERVVKYLSLKEKQRLRRQQRYAIFEHVTASQSSGTENDDVVIIKQEPTENEVAKKKKELTRSKLQQAREEVKELEQKLAAEQQRKKRPERETIDHEAGSKVDEQSSQASQEEGTETDAFFGVETFQESNAEEDPARSGSESSEPDFDEVPDEREAMMSRRQELVQKQHIGKKRALTKKKPGEKGKGDGCTFEEGSVAHFRHLKYGKFPPKKRPYEKQAGALPPSFDLENFMKSQTCSDKDQTPASSTDNRFENPGDGIDVESFLRTHVEVCVSEPGDSTMVKSQIENSPANSPAGDNSDGLEDEEETPDIDIRRVIMSDSDEPEPRDTGEVTSRTEGRLQASGETVTSRKGEENFDMNLNQDTDRSSNTVDTQDNQSTVDTTTEDYVRLSNSTGRVDDNNGTDVTESNQSEKFACQDQRSYNDWENIKNVPDNGSQCDVRENNSGQHSTLYDSDGGNAGAKVLGNEEKSGSVSSDPTEVRASVRNDGVSDVLAETMKAGQSPCRRGDTSMTSPAGEARETASPASAHKSRGNSPDSTTEMQEQSHHEASTERESRDIASPEKSLECSAEGNTFGEVSRMQEKKKPIKSRDQSYEREVPVSNTDAAQSRQDGKLPEESTGESNGKNADKHAESVESSIDMVEIGIIDDEFAEATATKDSDKQKRKESQPESEKHKSKKKASHKHKKQKHGKESSKTKDERDSGKRKKSVPEHRDEKEKCETSTDKTEKKEDPAGTTEVPQKTETEDKATTGAESTGHANEAALQEFAYPEYKPISGRRIKLKKPAAPQVKVAPSEVRKEKEATSPVVERRTITIAKRKDESTPEKTGKRRQSTNLKPETTPKKSKVDKAKKEKEEKVKSSKKLIQDSSEKSSKKKKADAQEIPTRQRGNEETDSRSPVRKRSRATSRSMSHPRSQQSRRSASKSQSKRRRESSGRLERKRKSRSRSKRPRSSRSASSDYSESKSRSRSRSRSRRRRGSKRDSRSRSRRDSYSRSRSRDDRSRSRGDRSRSRGRRSRSRGDRSRSRGDRSRSRGDRSRSRGGQRSRGDRSRSRDDRSRSRDDRSRSRSDRSRSRDDRSRSRGERSRSRGYRSRSRRSRSRSRRRYRSRSRSRSRSRRRRYSDSRSRSPRSRRNRSRYSRYSDSRSRSPPSKMYADKADYERDRAFSRDWKFGSPWFRGMPRGRGRGRFMRRPFGRGMHPGWGGRGMGFYQYHRQYFQPMWKSRLNFKIPPQVKQGQVPLSPLSKHLLMLHEHDSDSLDEDVRDTRRHDTESEDTESDESQSDCSEESDVYERRTSYKRKSMSSHMAKQMTRGSGRYRGRRQLQRQQLHGDSWKRKKSRREPVYEISSGDGEEGGSLAGDSDEGSEGQMEILELEMRARAIKAMLKAQEELDKAEKLRAQMKTKSPSSASVAKPGTSGSRSSRQLQGVQKGRTRSRQTQESSVQSSHSRGEEAIDPSQRRSKKRVIIRKIVKKKAKNPGLNVERQLAQDILEEATMSTSGQLQGMKK